MIINMVSLQRHPKNPILVPNPYNNWESDAAFNGCVVEKDGLYHMVYRALSSQQNHQGADMRISSVGYAKSENGIDFGEHRQLIAPTEAWEIYGCEDPRITFFEGKYYIFYTALSIYPFSPFGIKLGLGITTDFQNIEKHPITTFNSKAMALFPERINGKMAALVTINTDMPPAKIAIAYFDKEEDMWSPVFWDDWYQKANDNLLHIMKDITDQVELGSPPIKTPDGWLVIYSFIKNYMSNDKDFGIQAMLLDLNDPQKILGRTEYSLISPEEDYEMEGDVPNIVFPSSALIKDNKLYVYYGAADTKCAVATCDLEPLLDELRPKNEAAQEPVPPEITGANKLVRYEGNPIIAPIPELDWQAMGTFNPTAIYEAGKIHIIYRAQSRDGTSTMGYASTTDGFHLDENLNYPVFVPREPFEVKPHDVGNSGCEDGRITKIDDRFYMTYTAYDGVNPPRVAISSINVEDFLNKNWNWDKPKIISLPGIDDKDACIVKSRNPEQYLAFHRLGGAIWLDVSSSLDYCETKNLTGTVIVQPRPDKWDNVKLGIAGPPLETEHGWLLLYHGVSEPGYHYKVGAMLLDYHDPRTVLARTDEPIFEPEMDYELEGQIPNVVFPCGAVIKDGTLFVYYGGADSVTGVATMPLQNLLDLLLKK